MSSAGITVDDLRDCLLNLPTLELLGMKLLQDSPHVGFFPSNIPRDTFVRRQSISGTRGVELMETWFTFLPHFSPELQEVISTLL